MDDIEDLVAEGSIERSQGRSQVLPKPLRLPKSTGHSTPVGDNIPGVGTLYIKTWGCSHNNSDGEYMAGILSQYGYNITNGTAPNDC